MNFSKAGEVPTLTNTVNFVKWEAQRGIQVRKFYACAALGLDRDKSKQHKDKKKNTKKLNKIIAGCTGNRKLKEASVSPTKRYQLLGMVEL